MTPASKELTPDEINDLLKDWFVRDGETFTAITAEKRLAWEPTDSTEYSTLFSKNGDQLIRNAYQFCSRYIAGLNPPVNVVLRLNNSDKNCTDGKIVYVSTNVFDDTRLNSSQAVDVFLGIAAHETAHVLYTDFTYLSKVRPPRNRLEQFLRNVIEDERIERNLGRYRPGSVRFIEKMKHYVFDTIIHDAPKRPLSELEKVLQAFFAIIRYPKYLDKDQVLFFGEHFQKIKDALTPYPESSEEMAHASAEVYDILKSFLNKPKAEEGGEPEESEESESKKGKGKKGKGKSKKSDEDSEDDDSTDEGETEDEDDSDDDGDGGSDEDSDDDSDNPGDDSVDPFEEDSEDSDKSKSSSNYSGDSDGGGEESSPEPETVTDSDIERAMKDSDFARKLLEAIITKMEDEHKSIDPSKKLDKYTPEVLEGTLEILGSGHFLTKAEEDVREYQNSLARVGKFVPAVRNALKYKDRDYKVTHKGMRTGYLDMNKLTEAYQGTPTVYERYGHVKTDKVALCFLIDESGSMYGEEIQAARDTAILLYEAVKDNHSIELFVYGHTADMRQTGKVDLTVYKEPGFKAPKFALGSVQAHCQNRDGDAILLTAKRVRTMTKKHCLMFVLSDGQPAASGYGGMAGVMDTRSKVKQAQKLGFDIVQIAINHSYDPSSMFDNFIIFDELSNLSKDIGKFVRDNITKKQNINYG